MSKKKKKQKDQETQIDKEVKDLGNILSGEMALREKKEEILKEKKKAIEQQKKRIEKGLKDGSLKIKELEKNKKVVQKINLFEWEAPIRVPFQFEKRNFLLVVALCLLFIFYLAIVEQYLLMFAIIALLFLIYVAGTTKPVNVNHKITARGVETMNVLYEWYQLESFFFTKKKGEELLIIETNLRLPSRLIMLVGEKNRDSIFLLLQDQLLYKDIKKQHFLDKISIGEYIPLEEL